MNGWKSLLVMLAVVGPVAGLGLWLRHASLAHAQLEEQAREAAVSAAARESVAAAERRTRASVARMCQGELLVDRVLLELEGDRFGPLEQGALVEQVPPLMRAMDLAILTLIDGRAGARYGRVLAAGHYAGQAGADERELARGVERAGERTFVEAQRVRVGGEVEEASALLTGCVAQRGEARVVVVGGQLLDEGFLRSLNVPGARSVPGAEAGEGPPSATSEVVLTHSGGAPPTSRMASPSEPVVVATFRDLAGAEAATLLLVLDRGGLEARRKALDESVLAGVGLALLLALLLTGFLWWDLNRPLREIKKAAARIGEGDLQTQITLGSRGAGGQAAHSMNDLMQKLRARDVELAAQQKRLVRTERIAERIAAWRDIARQIAHEVKNPLTPIRTSIENMRKAHARQLSDFDEIFEESTSTVLEEVERLRRLVTEFSDFARMPAPSPVDLAVEDVARHVVGLYAGGEVEVSLELGEGLGPVRADKAQLTQVLVNLVKNACEAARARHGARGGRVAVEVRPHDVRDAHATRPDAAPRGVLVRVSDNGPGVPFDDREKIFAPYFTTKRESEGTGLGLAVVHRIVTDHGGTLEVTDAEGGGACFELRLPRSGPPRDASTTATDATAMPLVRRREP